MRKGPWAVCLVLLLLFGACGQSVEGDQTPVPLATPTAETQDCEFPETWNLEFRRVGGFAGFSESLTLGSNGALHIQSQQPPADVRKQLSEAQVEGIAGLLSRACPFEPEPDQGQCADCFYYELVINMNGRFYETVASDITLSPDLHALVGELSQLLQSTAP